MHLKIPHKIVDLFNKKENSIPKGNVEFIKEGETFRLNLI